MPEVLVLGPVEARCDDVAVGLGGARERGVLAALALVGPAGASSDRVVDLVWGEAAPPTAVRTLQAYLSRLRSALGANHVVTERAWHRLVDVDVDLWRWAQLRADPRRLDEALALWRDSVVAAGAALDGAHVEQSALSVERLDTTEALVLRTDDASAVAAAEALLAEDPHRERVWLRLAEAHYRLGRQGDALGVIRRARDVLVRDLGVDPTPELVALERDLLTHALPGRRPGVAPPAPLTPCVGRDDLVAAVRALLEQHRLVTLVGVGGVGKTRLAMAVTEGTSARWAGLAAASSAPDVESLLRVAVGADPDAPGTAAVVADRLQREPPLVVVDNCEHVVPVVAALVRDVLAAAPAAVVLATSRTPLGIAGERVVEVPPLDARGTGMSAAVRLFLDRAGEAAGRTAWSAEEVATAASVCRRVDGVPLALELTARRLRHESLQAIATTSADEPAPDAAGTVAAVLDRSVRLVDEPTREAYARLAVLRGPVPLDLAAVVAGGAERVRALHDVSLLVVREGRVRMYEPVRQHAARLLTPQARDDARRSAAEAVLAFAEQAARFYIGPDELRWLTAVDAVRADVRAALEWSAAHSEPELLARLVASVGYQWLLGWGVREGQPWVERALAVTTEGRIRTRLLVWASYIATRFGDLEHGRAYGHEAVERARGEGDARLLGDALHATALPDKHGDGREVAERLLREAYDVRLAAGDLAGAAMSLGALADICVNAGRPEDAVEGYAIGLPLMRASGSRRGLLSYLESMAQLALLRGDLDEADELVAEARVLAVETGDLWHAGLVAVDAAWAARDRGAAGDEQRALTVSALLAARAQTDPRVVLDAVEAAAGVLVDAGLFDDARRLLVPATEIRRRRGIPVGAQRAVRRDEDLHRCGSHVAVPVDLDADALVTLAIDALS